MSALTAALSVPLSTLLPGLPTLIGSLAAGQFLGMGGLVLAGACLQGVGGIGFAMVAAPVAAICYPELVPGPLLAMGGTVSMMSAWREREAIAWRLTGSAIAGRAVGGLGAVLAIAWMEPRLLAVLFSLSILAAVGLSVLGWRVQPSTGNLAIAGTASGFLGTITSAGAPPFAIVMQHMPPAPMRATIGSILGVGAALSLVMLGAAGRFGLPHLLLSALLLPFLLAGFALSSRIKGRVSALAVRRLLLALCALGAVAVLVRAAWQP